MESKKIVYILRRDADPKRHYVGLTSDVERRLHWHNTGPSGVTFPNRPWSLVVSVEFADATAAGRFERHLKTGSGRAFAKRLRALRRRVRRRTRKLNRTPLHATALFLSVCA